MSPLHSTSRPASSPGRLPRSTPRPSTCRTATRRRGSSHRTPTRSRAKDSSATPSSPNPPTPPAPRSTPRPQSSSRPVFPTRLPWTRRRSSTRSTPARPRALSARCPPFSPADFNVSWAGEDDTNGSGIATYDVYVSDDNGPFTLWQSATTQTSATYTGQDGHTYGFYSIATDNVGNVEATPLAAEAQTKVVMALLSIAPVSPNPRNTPVSAVQVTFDEPINLSTFTAADITLTDDGGANLITSAATTAFVSARPTRSMDSPDSRPEVAVTS